MKNAVVLLGLVAFILCSCGDKKNEEKVTQNEKSEIPVSTIIQPTKNTKISPTISSDWLKHVDNKPANFESIFKKFNSEEQYYFCAAFTIGAMSVAKPVTASAMVNYFLGIGVIKYKSGINQHTYKAFDFGKNIFHYDTVVNSILHKKTCENIIEKTTNFAKKSKLDTKDINEKGKREVKKIVYYIKKAKNMNKGK